MAIYENDSTMTLGKKLLHKQFQQKMSIKANIWWWPRRAWPSLAAQETQRRSAARRAGEANIDTTYYYDQQWIIIINTHAKPLKVRPH